MQKLNLNNIPEAPENKDFWVVGTANREGSIDSNSYKKNLGAIATKANSSSYYIDTYPQNPKEGDIITFTDDTPSQEYVNGEWKDRPAGGGGGASSVEHVTCLVRGCDMNVLASCEGGTVFVESYNPSTKENLPIQTYTIPASGIVEFDIPYGLDYMIYSKVSGLGASSRLTFVSSKENRNIHLWNSTIGVFSLGISAYSDGVDYRTYPYLSESPIGDGSGPGGSIGDDQNGVPGFDWLGTENAKDYGLTAVIVSSADCTVILQADFYKNTASWRTYRYMDNVPGLVEYTPTDFYEDYNKIVEILKGVYSGNLDTRKILEDAPMPVKDWYPTQTTSPEEMFNEEMFNAAQLASMSTPVGTYIPISHYCFQNYLPAVGELYLIYQNRTAINSLGLSVRTYFCWSSNAFNCQKAWYVRLYDGRVDYDSVDSNNNNVVSVSAFHSWY